MRIISMLTTLFVGTKRGFDIIETEAKEKFLMCSRVLGCSNQAKGSWSSCLGDTRAIVGLLVDWYEVVRRFDKTALRPT